MFFPVRKEIFRFGTPDPEGDWIMYGHVVVSDESVFLIDPPLVPKLLESAGKLGRVEGIILTTLDHTRGAKYISSKTGATLYVPDQAASKAVDPHSVLEQKGITSFEKYGEGSLHCFTARRLTVKGEDNDTVPWMDEFALQTGNRELLVGDIAVGTENGRVMAAPEWFPHEPAHDPWEPAHDVLKKLIRESGAVTLLASHGSNIYRNLQASLEYL